MSQKSPMAWFYQQSTGNLLLNAIFIGRGYSGIGAGLNDPGSQPIPCVGPIPVGSYSIGSPVIPQDHLGPLAFPLIPAPTNTMFGRFGFFIHGDNPSCNNTASNGCIALDYPLRQQIYQSGDNTLTVIA